jgi:hypothetical protein
MANKLGVAARIGPAGVVRREPAANPQRANL